MRCTVVYFGQFVYIFKSKEQIVEKHRIVKYLTNCQQNADKCKEEYID